MYDFYFGERKKIDQNPLKWLISIKRMLPRFCNSIPDSEYIALYNGLRELEPPDHPVLVETGCGASTIVMMEYILRYGGELYTWDICGNKLAYIRNVMNDTLFKYFYKSNLFTYWKYTAYNSTSQYAGIPILKELNKTVTACFFDSEHTLSTVKKEVEMTIEFMTNGGFVSIDDANYSYKYQNTAYVNMIRTKHGLPAIDDPIDNKCRPFYLEIEAILKEKFGEVNKVDDSYKKDFKKDIFWAYYNADREVMKNLSMEKNENLIHRFDAWICK